MSPDLGTWVNAICTLAVFTVLYRHNPVSKVTENLYVGIGAGYQLMLAYETVRNKAWIPLATKGEAKMAIPIVLGLLLFTNYVLPKAREWNKIAIAVMVAAGTAVTLKGTMEADFLGQIRGAISVPLTSFDAMLTFICTVSTIIYFLFTFSMKGVMATVSRLGYWAMMVAFGAGFGNTIGGRFAQFTGRMDVVFGEWLKLYTR